MNIWEYSKTGYFPPRHSRFWRWIFYKADNDYMFVHNNLNNICYSTKRLSEIIEEIGILHIDGYQYFGSVEMRERADYLGLMEYYVIRYKLL